MPPQLLEQMLLQAMLADTLVFGMLRVMGTRKARRRCWR
jgi:hypothetical protein